MFGQAEENCVLNGMAGSFRCFTFWRCICSVQGEWNGVDLQVPDRSNLSL